MITGKIIQVSPSAIGAGQALRISVAFSAYFEGITPYFETRVNAKLDGLSAGDVQTHVGGGEAYRDAQALHLGTMPGRAVSGSVSLQGRGASVWPFTPAWVTLDSRAITISLPAELPTVTPLPPVVTVPTYPTYPVEPVVEEPAWYEFWKPAVTPTIPTPPYQPEYPFTIPVLEEEKEKQTWIWVGLAVVAVVAVGFMVWRR